MRLVAIAVLLLLMLMMSVAPASAQMRYVDRDGVTHMSKGAMVAVDLWLRAYCHALYGFSYMYDPVAAVGPGFDARDARGPALCRPRQDQRLPAHGYM